MKALTTKKLKGDDKTTLRLFCGSVIDGYSEIPDDSVDVVVFSPPYFETDGWSPALMIGVGRFLKRVLKPGGRAYMVVAQIKESFARPMDSHRYLLKGGQDEDPKKRLHTGQRIMWVKSIFFEGRHRGQYKAINSPDLLHYLFEDVYVFVKGKTPAHPLNRIGIGVPFSDKTNITRGTRGKHGDVHCAGDTWFIPYTTVQKAEEKGHPHRFPLELARRCIVISGVPKGSVVCDPFMGGGTTAEAARLCGMHATGGDLNPSWIEKATAAWKAREGQRIPLNSGAL